MKVAGYLPVVGFKSEVERGTLFPSLLNGKVSMKNESNKALFLLIGASLVAASIAFAQEHSAAPLPDVLVFINGDQLTGTLVRGVGDSILFKSDMAGEVTVPLAKVKELRSQGKFAVLKKDTPVTRGQIHPGPVVMTKGDVIVTSPVGGPQQIPVKDVAYILDESTFNREVEGTPGFFAGWNGALTAGATFLQSTQHGGTFNAGLNLARMVPTVAFLRTRNRTLLSVNETYGKLTTPVIPQTLPAASDSVVKTNMFHGVVERDQYFAKRFYALAAVGFDHNYAQGLQLQSVYGVGIGWTVIGSARQQLDVTADLHYEKQQFQDSTNNANLIGSTFAETYRRTLPRKLLFTENSSVLPAWNKLDAYSANASANLALPLFKRLSLSVGSSDSFLNNPSVGYRRNSFQFLTGITYSLR